MDENINLNIHLTAWVSAPKNEWTEAQMDRMLSEMGLTKFDEKTFTKHDDGSLVFEAHFEAHLEDPLEDFWWLRVWQDTGEDVCIEIRWIYHIQDTSEGNSFEDVVRLYTFAKTTVGKVHAFFLSLDA